MKDIRKDKHNRWSRFSIKLNKKRYNFFVITPNSSVADMICVIRGYVFGINAKFLMYYKFTVLFLFVLNILNARLKAFLITGMMGQSKADKSLFPLHHCHHCVEALTKVSIKQLRNFVSDVNLMSCE